MRIAFVPARVPYPLDSGGRIRTFHLLRQAARRHDVVLVTATESEAEAEALAALRSEIPAVDTSPVVRVRPRNAPVRRVRRLLAAPLDPLPFTWSGFRDPAFARALRETIGGGGFDLVHCDHVQLGHAVPRAPGLGRLVNAHNLEWVVLDRLAAGERRASVRAFLRWQARKTRAAEARTYAAFDLGVACSEIDARGIASLAPELPVRVVPNGVDVEAFRPKPGLPPGRRVAFTGALDWRPNAEGVEWFLEQGAAELFRRVPEAELWIVGKNPPASLRRHASERVHLTGSVPDVRPYVEQARVFVVPLRTGSGTRLKILEAWAMGKAVVSTPTGAEGLPAVDGENLRLAGDPRELAAAVADLLVDDARCAALGAAGRRVVERELSWERVAAPLLAAYEETVARARRAAA